MVDLIELVLQELDKQGLMAYVAGGFARDMFFGTSFAKDVDIACVSVSDRGRAAAFLEQALPLKTGLIFQSSRTLPLSCCQGITDIFKFKSKSGFGLDILLKNNCQTLQQVMDNVDYNLSQFALVEGTPRYLGKTDLRVLHKVRTYVSDPREIKMQQRHTELLPTIRSWYDSGLLI